jgi:hypothetical protein
VETFSNLDNWILSNWAASMGGQFQPDHVDISQGLLRLKVTQNPSVGGEVQFYQALGYGTYEWVARMGSTSPTPDGVGGAVKGGVSGLFSYINGSETELDFEHEGQYPDGIEVTTWRNLIVQTTNTINVSGPSNTFHTYKYVWTVGKVEYYIDDVLKATHTTNVPTTPAYPLMSHYGTDSPLFGGLATPGVDRYMFVRSCVYLSMNSNATNCIPDFPPDTRFFVSRDTDKKFWRMTRPFMMVDENLIGSWDIRADGTVIAHQYTHIDFCTESMAELKRDDALAIFRNVCSLDLRLPEGF